MKLSTETLEILNSFRDINESVIIYPGNVIKTKSVDNRIFAEAVIEETFDRECAFYSLKGFLDAYNILGSPEVVLSDENYVLLQDGSNQIKYYYSEPSLIVSPDPNLNFQLKTKDVCFHLNQVHLHKMLKMTTFDSDKKQWVVDFICDDGEIQLLVHNRKDPTKPSYSTVVGESTHKFHFSTFLDTMLFINGSYDIVISAMNFLEAKNTRRNLRYLMPLSPESTFEK
jgi:hypothetical protein